MNNRKKVSFNNVNLYIYFLDGINKYDQSCQSDNIHLFFLRFQMETLYPLEVATRYINIGLLTRYFIIFLAY